MSSYDDAYARERGRLDARRDAAHDAREDRLRARRHFRGFREPDPFPADPFFILPGHDEPPPAVWFDPQHLDLGVT